MKQSRKLHNKPKTQDIKKHMQYNKMKMKNETTQSRRKLHNKPKTQDLKKHMQQDK
jgi:hypothetical protein